MNNRLKRVFSTVLCAAVMLTMTAVPGTAFAESSDEPEAAAQAAVQTPGEENQENDIADGVESTTTDQNEGSAEDADQVNTQEEAIVPAAVQTAARQMNTVIAPYEFSAVRISVTHAGQRAR